MADFRACIKLLQIREEPVISWSDDCECKQQVSAVADLLEKLVVTDGDIKNSKSEAASRSNTKVDCESQTEANSTQMDRAYADELQERLIEPELEVTVSMQGQEMEEDISAEDMNELKQQLKEKDRENEAMRLQQYQEKEEMKEHRIEILKLEAQNSCLKAQIRSMKNKLQECKCKSTAQDIANGQIIARQCVVIGERNKCFKEIKDNEKAYKKQLQEEAVPRAQIELSKVTQNTVASFSCRRITMVVVCICAAELLLWWVWCLWFKE
jgi:hypothetical protein